MKVKLNGFLTLREHFTSLPSLELQEGSTLRDLLQNLPPVILQAVEAREAGSNDVRKLGTYAILINGVHYSHLPEGLETPLKESDQIAVFPPIAGG